MIVINSQLITPPKMFIAGKMNETSGKADQHDTIDLLLDYGVDVNTFNDEGLTPLNLCLLRRLAQSNKICSWETAFLPTEIQKPTENNVKDEVWEDEESIESLDRIFGDGMSADSKTVISQMLEPDGYTNETEEERETKMLGSGHQTLAMKAEVVPKSIRRDEFEQSVKSSAQDRYLFDLSCERPAAGEADTKKDAPRSKNTKIPKEVVKIEKLEEERECERKKIDPALVEKLTQIDKTIEKLLGRGADPNISEVPKPSIHLGVFTKDINLVNALLQYGADPNCQTYPNEGLLTPLHVIALLKSAPENVEICMILLKADANPEEETSPDFRIYEGEKGFLDNVQGRTPLQILCMRPDLEFADPKGYVIQIGLMLAKYSDKKHFYKGHSPLTLAMLMGNIKLLTALLESNYYDPNELLGNDLGTTLHVLVSTEFQKKTIYEKSIKMCDLLLSAKADPLKVYETPQKLMGTCVDYGYREIEVEKAMRKASGLDKKEGKGSKQEKGGARDHLKDHIKVVEYLEKKASDLRNPTEKNKIQRGNDGFTKFGDGERRRKPKVKEEENDALKEKGNPAQSNKENKAKDLEQTEKRRRENDKTKNPKTDQTGNPKTDQTGNPKTDQTRKQRSFDETESNVNPKGESQTKNLNQKKRRGEKDSKKQETGPKKVNASKNTKKTLDEKMADDKDGRQHSKPRLDKQTNKIQKSSKKDPSERFPENLRRSILQVFGNCVSIDVNQLLLPYVVLRNGDLYYRFEGQRSHNTEQYSLI